MSLKTRKISSLIILSFCISVTIVFVIATSTTGVKSIDEMTDIRARIRNLTPIENDNSVSFNLTLYEYNSLFRIRASHSKLFDYKSFINDFENIEVMYFTIPMEDLNDVNQHKRIDILGIRTPDKIYLDKTETLRKDRNTRRFTAPIGGLLLVLLSLEFTSIVGIIIKYDF